MRARLLLFTKPAIPGRVKTRLAASIGNQRAAALHRAFVGDVAERLSRHDDFDLEIAWALDGGAVRPDWPETRHLRWRRQVGQSLGDRLFAALEEAADGRHAVAAVGSDHPELAESHVALAFERIREGEDVVLGPALDGGYYLIALAPGRVHRRLFEGIAWSTEMVREQTLERAGELGLKVSELEPGHDVDVEADLLRLAGRLQEGDLDCPRTYALLAEWGWIAKGQEASCGGSS